MSNATNRCDETVHHSEPPMQRSGIANLATEHTEDLLEAEAEGTSLTADLKINIGSALKPMFTHFAFVDLSNLGSEVKRERREGRINQVFVRV
jgi:hypothetical protein